MFHLTRSARLRMDIVPALARMLRADSATDRHAMPMSSAHCPVERLRYAAVPTGLPAAAAAVAAHALGDLLSLLPAHGNSCGHASGPALLGGDVGSNADLWPSLPDVEAMDSNPRDDSSGRLRRALE